MEEDKNQQEHQDANRETSNLYKAGLIVLAMWALFGVFLLIKDIVVIVHH